MMMRVALLFPVIFFLAPLVSFAQLIDVREYKQMTPYERLGVDLWASDSEIRTAFREKALELHPDRHSRSPLGEQKRAEELFKLLAEAYHELLNPKRFAKKGRWNPGKQEGANSTENHSESRTDRESERQRIEELFRSFQKTLKANEKREANTYKQIEKTIWEERQKHQDDRLFQKAMLEFLLKQKKNKRLNLREVLEFKFYFKDPLEFLFTFKKRVFPQREKWIFLTHLLEAVGVEEFNNTRQVNHPSNTSLRQVQSWLQSATKAQSRLEFIEAYYYWLKKWMEGYQPHKKAANSLRHEPIYLSFLKLVRHERWSQLPNFIHSIIKSHLVNPSVHHAAHDAWRVIEENLSPLLKSEAPHRSTKVQTQKAKLLPQGGATANKCILLLQ